MTAFTMEMQMNDRQMQKVVELNEVDKFPYEEAVRMVWNNAEYEDLI